MSALNRKTNLAHVGGQFPACVNDILAQISIFIKQHGQKWARVKAADLQSRIDHDLFCLSPDRRSSKLNDLQRLKLMGMLCTFFAQGHNQLANEKLANCQNSLIPELVNAKKVANEKTRQGRKLTKGMSHQPRKIAKEELRTNRLERHMLFEVIFCGREGETLLHDIRISFLVKWTVMALQYPVYPVFEDIAQWLHKVGSGKAYAERVVGELLDKFILIPDKYKMYEYVTPLRAHALPFTLFFLVHSISEESMCLPLIIVLSQWISTNPKGFIDLFREHNQLAEKFAAQKFDLLLEYDNENKGMGEVDDRLHFSITSLLVEWNSCGGHKLMCASLLRTLPHFPHLPAVAQQRVAENVENAVRMEHISVDNIQPKLPEEFFRLPDFSARFDGLLEQE